MEQRWNRPKYNQNRNYNNNNYQKGGTPYYQKNKNQNYNNDQRNLKKGKWEPKQEEPKPLSKLEKAKLILQNLGLKPSNEGNNIKKIAENDNNNNVNEKEELPEDNGKEEKNTEPTKDSQIQLNLTKEQLDSILLYIDDNILQPSLLVEYSVGFTWKIPLFAHLFLCINEKETQHSYIKSTLQAISEGLAESFSKGEYYRTKALLRLCAALVAYRVIDAQALIEIYEAILSFAKQHVASKNEQEYQSVALGDYFYWLILSTLPWCVGLFENQVFLEKIWKPIAAYMQSRTLQFPSLLSPWGNSALSSKKEPITALWNTLCTLQEKPADQRTIQTLKLNLDQILSPVQHMVPLPKFSINYDINITRNLNRQVFSLFEQVEESIPHLDQFILQEQILDVIANFSLDFKEGVNQFEYFLRGQYETLDQILLQTLFEQLLLLPQPLYPEIYYADLICELFKRKPKVFPGLIKIALEKIVSNFQAFDSECANRLSTWFAFHLNTFNFKWPWGVWESIVKEDVLSPRRVWLGQVFEKLIRLSYYEKVQGCLESFPSMQELLPRKPQPSYYFSDSSIEGHAEAERLLVKLRSKEPARDIVTWIEDDTAYLKLKFPVNVEIIAQCFCNLSSKFFSYFHSSCERYRDLLAWICTSQENNIAFLNSVAKFWATHPQNIEIYFERFVTTGIIPPLSIARWIFTLTNLEKQYAWTILRKTTAKVLSKTAQAKSQGDPTKLQAAEQEQAEYFQTLWQLFLEKLKEDSPFVLAYFKEFGRTNISYIWKHLQAWNPATQPLTELKTEFQKL